MIYLKYLWYVLKHKWFVFIECCKLGIPWRGIVHDWSKFLPSEFIPYARHFYGDIHKGRDATGSYDPSKDDGPFAVAWLHHQRRNPHHWQYWVEFKGPRKGFKFYEMPMKYRLEMLADWRGASLAQGKGQNILPWFLNAAKDMWFATETARWVENAVGYQRSEEEEQGPLNRKV